VPNKLAPEWSLIILAKVGVPYLVILDKYEGVVLHDNRGLLSGEDDAKRIDQVRAMIELLGFWVSSAQASASDNVARRDLARALTSGRLLPKIDAIKGKLETLTNTAPLLDRVRNIELAIQSSV
jgi:hypothetical protein